MRCYKKPFSWATAQEEIRWDFGVSPFDSSSPPSNLYFVYVCGFRFVFASLTQIAEYRALFAHKLKPSFREGGIGADSGYYSGDHGEAQSAFARLPLYLWQKGKRERVVAGLDRAIREFAKG